MVCQLLDLWCLYLCTCGEYLSSYLRRRRWSWRQLFALSYCAFGLVMPFQKEFALSALAALSMSAILLTWDTWKAA